MLAALAIARCALVEPRAAEVHGAVDAFAAPGLALAWGVLRGKDEATTEVVVRIEVDPDTYGAVAVIGVDPFTRARAPLLAATPIKGAFEFRVPRSRFADLPRTEWHFYKTATLPPDDAAALSVYYQGVPDTTPEFNDEAKLSAYLGARIERARRDAKGRP
jgi:hypothetical protein